MPTPEGRVKDKLKQLLKERGAYWYMPVSNGMGAPALDFICCYKGYFFSIETKVGKKGMTLRQQRTADQIEKSGGLTFLINETNETWQALNAWLDRIDRGLKE